MAKTHFVIHIPDVSPCRTLSTIKNSSRVLLRFHLKILRMSLSDPFPKKYTLIEYALRNFNTPCSAFKFECHFYVDQAYIPKTILTTFHEKESSENERRPCFPFVTPCINRHCFSCSHTVFRTVRSDRILVHFTFLPLHQLVWKLTTPTWSPEARRDAD